MFCSKCGNQISDDTKFCDKCGAPQGGSVSSSETKQLVNIDSLKKNQPLIVLAAAIIALIFGIITIFNLFDATATVTYGSESTSASGPIADIIDGEGMGSIQFGNIVFGLVLIAVAALGILFFAKNYGVKVYDSLTKIPYITKESPLFAMGALGAIGAVIHFICFLFAGETVKRFGEEVSTSVSTPWFTWVILVLFAGFAALDKLVINKKQ